MPDALYPKPSLSAANEPARKPYHTPVLHTYGDVVRLTQAAYGGLNKNLYGFLFAQSSIALPPPPIR